MIWKIGLILTAVILFGSSENSRKVIIENGAALNVTWLTLREDNFTISDYISAHKSCSKLFTESKGRLPKVLEVKYFYKSIPLDVNKDTYFYLQNIIESTTDFPTDSEGERLCLVLKKSTGGVVELAPSDTAKSCQKRVNLLVCVMETIKQRESGTNIAWISELERKALISDTNFCLQPTTFYVSIGMILTVSLVLVLLIFIFYYKWYQSKQLFSLPKNASSSGRTTSTNAPTFIRNKLDFLDDDDTLHSPCSEITRLQNQSLRASLRSSERLRQLAKLQLGKDSPSIDEDYVYAPGATDFL
ncbi:hypothetical protein Ciccas_003133 [Cichlidogyrus casuarinus]|uniref:Uncharacterized protein n=1 Tax=Cichlidogyrus casuarinus TaxID=1844966 RepID=A0ABD2QF91_9PLAT